MGIPDFMGNWRDIYHYLYLAESGLDIIVQLFIQFALPFGYVIFQN